MISYRKIGGMRFLRLARLQLSWCVVRPRTAYEIETERQVRKAKRAGERALKRARR